MKNVGRILAFVMSMVLLLGCFPQNTWAAVKKESVKSVTIINPKTERLVIKQKKTYRLKVKVEAGKKVSKKVTFSSSNKKVVTVNASGKIKALKKGTVTITVRSKVNPKKKDTIRVTVGTPVTKVILNKKSIRGKVGEQVSLKVRFSPKKPSIKKVTYKTSNKKIAKVSSKGKVSLIAEGTAKITVQAADGSGKKAVCIVKVSKKNTNPETPKEEPKDPPKEEPKDDPKDLSYEGYQLKWEDDFNESALNLADWNYEEHDPGWVNNELQKYVVSENNIFLKDGNLVIRPVKTVAGNGDVSYTSGRINTKNKQDFTYGLFEVRAKVPAGQGFLPAFWLMPTDENLYGQWPRCGEIDAMEVLGSDVTTAFGTIHYGEPHRESQGTYKLKSGNYADEYHTFSCEWEPGKISWYVDGRLYHTENDWYSKTTNQGEITYPAPFDQPFYIILNLAVGGNWPGNPDNTTSFENNDFMIDYVKVYQKNSYNEDVKKPVKEVVLREPDANGNYINNGNFSVNEDLADDVDWKFLNALGGAGAAQIANNAIRISMDNAGTASYSIQLVQPNLPMKKGATYKVSFDAVAQEDRTMIVDVSAPDRGYQRYLADTTVALTTQKQSFTYEFTMTDDNDANGRLEFNLGATSSTADVEISNISVIKTAESTIIQDPAKTILADGNHVYNGGFQEGENRLGYWDIVNSCNAEVLVTNENTQRRLKVSTQNSTSDTDVTVSQNGLALSPEKEYLLTFDAQGSSSQTLNVLVAGKTYQAQLSQDNQSYSYKFTTDANLTDKSIAFRLGINGVTYLDNVRIVENSLIKNGDFSAGFSGYEVYAYTTSDVDYVVDSLSEANAADFTIRNTGDAAWKIQLKQNNVELDKDQWYRLSLDAKSNLDRKLMFAIQKDGSSDNDWTPYSGEKIVNLSSGYETYTIEFQMKNETDLKSILSISMGAVSGVQIATPHRICIDNIKLEKIDAPKITIPQGENLLKNADFSSGEENWAVAVSAPGAADHSISENSIQYNITNVGTADWNVQLKQQDLPLEKDCDYVATFKAISTKSRVIKLAFMSTSYNWYGGEDISLEANTEKLVTVRFHMNEETDLASTMVVSMGAIAGVDTPVSSIRLSDFSLKKE